MIVPNFFIIGAPKCGTTALSEYLRDHPNIFMSSHKEPKYFDFDLFNPMKLDLKSYLDLFKGADPQRHKAVGEASVTYLFSDCAVGEILKFNPEAKFIAMLRNPLDQAQAWHSQKIIDGQETLLDFEKAWRAQSDRKNGKGIPFSCWEPKQLQYSQWAKQGGLLERLYTTVPQDRVKVILLDDFAADTQGVYQDVLSFLGVPPDGRDTFPRVNENKRIRWTWLQPFLVTIIAKVEPMKKWVGWKGGLGLMGTILNMNRRHAQREPISSHLQNELRVYFQEDVMKLAHLLDRDLSHWISPARKSPTAPPQGHP